MVEMVKNWFPAILLVICLLGVAARFYHIQENNFIYYDEGMYLDHNSKFLQVADRYPPKNLNQLFKYLSVSWHAAIRDTKIIWFFLSDLRTYLFGFDAWFFTRLLSAAFGSLTILFIFLLAKKYYASTLMGLLSAAVLAFLPSHVYYSRLGMQEALSTCLFVAGLYFYLFPKKVHWKTFVSALFFSMVFFSNYRMIILPVLVFLIECFVSLKDKSIIDIRKWVWHSLFFAAVVVLVGSLEGGVHTKITFEWIFFQSNLADGTFDWLNLFSYPYYIFHLESLLFGFLFFGNIFLVVKKRWDLALPFLVVILFMAIFSLPQEKGVRYLCAVMPLMAMSVVGVLKYLMESFKQGKAVVYVLSGLLLIWHSVKVYEIIQFKSAYKLSVEDILNKDKTAGVLSSQPLLQKLYMADRNKVTAIPKNLKYFIVLYRMGYRYIILDTQAYISMTQDGNRFSHQLYGYLDVLRRDVKPVKIYPHFTGQIFERFVLEHNEHLPRSLRFIKEKDRFQYGTLRIYDIRDCISALKNIYG